MQCHAGTGEWGWAPLGWGGGVTPSFSLRAKGFVLGLVSCTLGPSLAADGKSLSISGLRFSHLYNGSCDLPARRSRDSLREGAGCVIVDSGGQRGVDAGLAPLCISFSTFSAVNAEKESCLGACAWGVHFLTL